MLILRIALKASNPVEYLELHPGYSLKLSNYETKAELHTRYMRRTNKGIHWQSTMEHTLKNFSNRFLIRLCVSPQRSFEIKTISDPSKNVGGLSLRIMLSRRIRNVAPFVSIMYSNMTGAFEKHFVKRDPLTMAEGIIVNNTRNGIVWRLENESQALKMITQLNHWCSYPLSSIVHPHKDY